MAESPEHQGLVREMVNWMRGQGVSVSSAAGGLALPDPDAIGRHEPDGLGTRDAVVWIGEAKIGPDLYHAHSQEQLKDFSQRKMSQSGKPCPFILCVPRGREDEARKAIRHAGGSLNNLTLIS